MKKFALFVLLSALAATSYGLYMYYKPRTSLVNATSEFTRQAPELVTAFQADEQAANEQFLGRVGDIYGEVAEIRTDDSGRVAILLLSDDPMSYVLCNMDMRSWDDTGAGHPGDRIGIKGKCSGWLMDVVMTDCVMQSPEPGLPVDNG